MNFSIEKRGEIVLKGKGKKMAYVVRPAEHGQFQVEDGPGSMPPPIHGMPKP
jgi:hypothetical protein